MDKQLYCVNTVSPNGTTSSYVDSLYPLEAKDKVVFGYAFHYEPYNHMYAPIGEIFNALVEKSPELKTIYDYLHEYLYHTGSEKIATNFFRFVLNDCGGLHNLLDKPLNS